MTLEHKTPFQMNRSYLWQLAIFVIVLVLLNLLFQLHISIIGSLVLTIGLSLLFNFLGRK